MKILVAEDEPVIAKSYKLILEDRGHEVSLTFNGEECIESYKSELSSGIHSDCAPFDLVILDYMMPRKDGVEVAGEMLSLCPSQRIIVASAFSEDNLVQSLEALKGKIEVLQKPFGLAALVNLIESCGQSLLAENQPAETINTSYAHEQSYFVISKDPSREANYS